MIWLVLKSVDYLLVQQRRRWEHTYFTCQMGGLTALPMFILDDLEKHQLNGRGDY
jgi:hypothetical protein